MVCRLLGFGLGVFDDLCDLQFRDCPVPDGDIEQIVSCRDLTEQLGDRAPGHALGLRVVTLDVDLSRVVHLHSPSPMLSSSSGSGWNSRLSIGALTSSLKISA